MKYWIPFFIVILLCQHFHVSAQTTYHNFSDFKDAVANAKPGDEIILAEGRYNAESITMSSVTGTADMPVIIRAESIGSDTLDAGTYFDLRHCSYITIQGFVINITEKSNTFKIQTCDHIRITQNTLDGSGEDYYKDDGVSRNSSVWINLQSLWDDPVGLSHHNQIDHNTFKNKHTLGNMIRVDGTNELYVSQYDVIEFNYFKNMGPRAENEMEAIRIGWSAMSQSDGYTRVSNNLFEECNGDPEIISVKCNKNTISHNTFRRCQGTLSLRHGNESLVEGNFFFGEGVEGTGGLRIYGSDHRIINNYFEGLTGTKWHAPITLTNGDVEEGSGSLSNHFRIERAILANNTLVNNMHGIEVGFDNSGKYSKPPRDVILAYNIISGDTNSLVNYINPPDNITWVKNLMFPEEDANIGNGVTFSEVEAIVLNPNLSMNDTLGYYKSTDSTAKYIPAFEPVGNIVQDIDGQARLSNTNYGADEFSLASVAYKPLTPLDVGPSMGEYLYVTESEILFSVSAGSTALYVSSNLNWTVTRDSSWISVDPSSGSGDGIIMVAVQENSTGLPRKGSITIESTNATVGDNIIKTIIISQSDTEPPVLNVSKSNLSFTPGSGNDSVSITSNIDWSVNSDASWIRVEPAVGSGDGTLAIFVDENESRSSRSDTITITDGGMMTRIIEIMQEGSVGTEEKLVIVDAIASTEQTSEGNIATNVFDGILTNRWSGDGDGAYITLDLQRVSKVSFIKVGLYKGDQRHSMFDLLTSVDGIEFSEALTGVTSEITTEPLVLYDFNDTIARYVRIVGHGNSTSTWNSYTEFEVWGWPPENVSDESISQDKGIDLNIFPNPSTGTFNITLHEEFEITILNIGGQIVYENKDVQGNEINVSGLEPGLYIVLVKTRTQLHTRKVIVK